MSQYPGPFDNSFTQQITHEFLPYHSYSTYFSVVVWLPVLQQQRSAAVTGPPLYCYSLFSLIFFYKKIFLIILLLGIINAYRMTMQWWWLLNSGYLRCEFECITPKSLIYLVHCWKETQSASVQKNNLLIKNAVNKMMKVLWSSFLSCYNEFMGLFHFPPKMMIAIHVHLKLSGYERTLCRFYRYHIN